MGKYKIVMEAESIIPGVNDQWTVAVYAPSLYSALHFAIENARSETKTPRPVNAYHLSENHYPIRCSGFLCWMYALIADWRIKK